MVVWDKPQGSSGGIQGIFQLTTVPLMRDEAWISWSDASGPGLGCGQQEKEKASDRI